MASNYGNEELCRMADAYRPHGSRINPAMQNPGRLLRIIAEPARRHRCEFCREVFECHLCSLRVDHHLHKETPDRSASRPTICESCIAKHEMWIVITMIHSSNRWGAYDHLTGELQGFGRNWLWLFQKERLAARKGRPKSGEGRRG